MTRRSSAKAPPPAYFTALELKNVRCFGAEEQRIELRDRDGRPARWTVILGDNGTGKTTLLRCLALCAPSPNDLTPTEEFFRPKLGNYDEEEAWAMLQRGDGDPGFALTVHCTGHIHLTKPHQQGNDFTVSVDSEEGGEWYQRDQGFPICYGYGAARHMSESALSDYEIKDSAASLFDAEVPLLNPEEWLLRADYAASKPSQIQSQLRSYRDRVKRMLVDLLPDVSDIKFTRPTLSRQRPSVRFVTPYGSVGLKDLSLGYTTLIAWLVDFASKMFSHYGEFSNPLAMPAICLVDELDLHLHPRWQRSIMSYLSKRFSNTQFIVTAHSPLVVQSAEDANVVVLRRDGDHVVIDNHPREVSRWRVDQILTSDLFGIEGARANGIEALLQKRRKLLTKSRLTAAEKKRLAALEEEIGYLPTAASPAEIEAMELILAAAPKLAGKAKGKK